MSYNLWNWGPLLWIKLQNVDNQTFQLFTKVTTELIVSHLYLFSHFLKILCRKWRKTVNEFIEKNPQSPNINRVVIFFLKDHFGRHIFISSTKSLSFHLNIISRPSQITDLDIIGTIKQNVLWLHFMMFTLISLCIMSLECKYRIADRVWLKNLKLSA